MRILLALVLAGLLGFSAYSGYKLDQLTESSNDCKYDFAEINKITYGLFNIDIWKDKIFSIIESKAQGFDFSGKDLQGFQSQIEGYLYNLNAEYIESGKLVELLMESQKKDNALMGLMMNLFKGSIEDQVKNVDFKSQIPGIAAQMMGEFEKKIPELKKQITKQVSDMLVNESTSKLQDQRALIYEKYGTDNLKDTNEAIELKVDTQQVEINNLITYILIALGICACICIFLWKGLTFKWAMLGLTLTCIVFLGLGLALPMIDLDARLSDVHLKLIGEELHFDEQVMYFQSKSILDVTRTLISGKALDMRLVGILILLFSIVLPFLKMIFTTGYLFVDKYRKSRFMRAVIFHLGKWSMADVFVVAIFMAYIGFYGLLNSQMGSMAQDAETVSIETVNYSKFSPGIIFFTLYCLLSILMSTLIHRKESKVGGTL